MIDGYEHRVIRGTSVDDPSGALRAQEAHQAGAVVPPVEEPTCDVHIEFRVHTSQEEADGLAEAVVKVLLDHPLIVPPVAFSVTVRDTAAAG